MYGSMKKRDAPFMLEKRCAQRMRVENKGVGLSQIPRVDCPLARPLTIKPVFPSLKDNSRPHFLNAEVNGDAEAREHGERDSYQWVRASENIGDDGQRDGKLPSKILWGGGTWIDSAAKPNGEGRSDYSSHCPSDGAKAFPFEKEAVPQNEDGSKKSGQGQERTLVQLKIDTMFTIASPTNYKYVTAGVGVAVGSQQPEEEREVSKSARLGVIDVDGAPSCYVCRGRFGAEGGDVLCSFCDRSVCKDCSQHCFTCDITHCSLCLAADFTSPYESYFCPPCSEEKRRETCDRSHTDNMVT